MSLRLTLLNWVLRRFVRPALARAKTPAAARADFERKAARFVFSTKGIRFAAEHVEGAGGPIPVEWVSYERAARRQVVIYLHGGAHIMGSPRTHRPITSVLARLTGARVMVPDFRLAPEHPVPAAINDAVACYSWLLANGYDAGSIALAGESSGGGMCFAVLLELQRLGFPPPACVAAFSPWVDLTMSSGSVRENAEREVMLPVERAEEVLEFYCGTGDPKQPLASPLFGEFRDPPPVLLQVSRAEILRDDAVSMAAHLREAGGEVTLELWENTPHAWQFFAAFVPEAKDSMNRAGKFIRAHLNG